MNIKKIILIFPFLIGVATALTVDEVSGKYTIHGTSWNRQTDAVTDQLSTLAVSKIQDSKTSVVVNMNWLSGDRGGCEIDNQVATVAGNSLTLGIGDCTLRIDYEVAKSQITFHDVNGDTGSCRAQLCGSTAGFSDVGFPWNSQERNGKIETTLKPIPGQTLCFSRTYTTEHLNTNPRQIPDMMVVKITGQNDGTYTDELTVYDRSADENVYRGKGSCSNDPTVPFSSSKASCGVSNNGGQYLVEKNAGEDGSILLKPFNWVELHSPEAAIPPIRLDKDDIANSLFKLYPAGCDF